MRAVAALPGFLALTVAWPTPVAWSVGRLVPVLMLFVYRVIPVPPTPAGAPVEEVVGAEVVFEPWTIVPLPQLYVLPLASVPWLVGAVVFPSGDEICVCERGGAEGVGRG